MCQFDCYDLSAYRKKPFASLTYLYNYFWYLYYSNYLQGKNKGALGANYNTYQLPCFSSCFAPKSHGLRTTFDKKVDLGWKPVTCIFYAKKQALGDFYALVIFSSCFTSKLLELGATLRKSRTHLIIIIIFSIDYHALVSPQSSWCFIKCASCTKTSYKTYLEV